MSAAVDPVAALRVVLLADADVSALVSTRVYGGEVPEDETKGMPQACIILSPSGGRPFGPEGFTEYGQTRIDTVTHGATLQEAWEVYLAAYSVLKHLNRHVAAQVLLHSIDPLSKGALGRDPETQWPTTLASWRVLASEVAAA